MKYDNVAPPEIANEHLNRIQGMFDSSGEGIDLWRHLAGSERLVLCQFAGVNAELAGQSIKQFSALELHRLRKGVKRLEKLAKHFNSISTLDFR